MVAKKDEQSESTEKIVRDGNKDCSSGAYVRISQEYKVNTSITSFDCG